MDPFVGLSATYAVALIGSILLSIVTQWTFFNQQKFTFTKYNLLLGLIIIGVEGGYMLMYRAGWPISKASITVNIILAIVLVMVGAIIFHEPINIKKIIGIILCILGILFL